jgi:hypothetical protein
LSRQDKSGSRHFNPAQPMAGAPLIPNATERYDGTAMVFDADANFFAYLPKKMSDSVRQRAPMRGQCRSRE